MFKEDNGSVSMARVLSFVIVIVGLAIGFLMALSGKVNGATETLSLGLVGLGFTGKIVQKKLEK